MSETVTYSEPAYFYRLQLSTPDPEKPEEKANMMFGLDGDTPEILVWPRGDSQKGKAPIRARLNTTAFGIHVANLFERAANGEPGFHGTLPIIANRKDGDSYVPKVVTTLVCAKRKDGVVVTGLVDADDSRTRILFPMILLDWVQAPVINREPLDEAAISVDCAKFYANFFRNLANNHALKQTTAQRKEFMDEIRRKREERKGGNFSSVRPAPTADDFNF